MPVVVERIAVPGEITRAARHNLRHLPCILCRHPLDGTRSVASTTNLDALEGDSNGPLPAWVAHHSCYLDAFTRALRTVPELALAPSENHAHQAFRNALTARAAAVIHS